MTNSMLYTASAPAFRPHELTAVPRAHIRCDDKDLEHIQAGGRGQKDSAAQERQHTISAGAAITMRLPNLGLQADQTQPRLAKSGMARAMTTRVPHQRCTRSTRVS